MIESPTRRTLLFGLVVTTCLALLFLYLWLDAKMELADAKGATRLQEARADALQEQSAILGRELDRRARKTMTGDAGWLCDRVPCNPGDLIRQPPSDLHGDQKPAVGDPWPQRH